MPVSILHIHSTFSLGGKEARAVRLMNSFGSHARHSVISAVPGALSARHAIDPGLTVEFPGHHPPLTGMPSLSRYRALARYMRGFDLVLTYNWGAVDALAARRLFGGPSLVHHEDGFNVDEAAGQKPLRVWFRRLVLGTAKAVIVPSQTLERIALTSWRQPGARVHRIANGIALDRYLLAPDQTAIPGYARPAQGVVVGTMAGLRAVKNLPRLVRAFAASGLTDLVIAGEGREKGAIEDQARRCAVKVRLPGFLPDPSRFLGLFDIFALSSDSEQQPISLIEAMAAGLPVVSTDVGDIRNMVAEENLPFIVPADREDLFSAALVRLENEPVLRHGIGAANRAKALQFFDEKQMIARYRTLYADALGQRNALGQAQI